MALDVDAFVTEHLLDPDLGLGNPRRGDLLDWLRAQAPPWLDGVVQGVLARREAIEGALWAVRGRDGSYRAKCRFAIEDFLAGRRDEAVQHLMRAKWDIDAYALAHYLLGLVYLAEGRTSEALAELAEAERREPYDKQRVQAVVRAIEEHAAAGPAR
jgi:tetratricopeptide (TPR) repeat protein